MIREIIQWIYDTTIRRRLPRKIVVHNGVPVRSGRLLDATDVKPDYEGALVAAMRERIGRGDDVVIVGGGYGVSAVVAYRQAGSGGSVTVYEGAYTQVERITETLALNGANDEINVNHAFVGSAANLWGENEGASKVAPEELPQCDVLVLDCEGAEIGIIKNANLPGTVIVETHGIYDAPTEEVCRLLEESGMIIKADRTEIAEEDVHVLTAVK